MITTEQKTNEQEAGMGFNPGFPPNFDPERAERGLAQEDDDEVDLPQPHEPTLEDALEHALTSHVEGAATRWLRLQRNGATDAELLARVADEFQGCGGSSRNGGWSVKGGKSPQFTWFDDGPLHKAQKLKGKRLLARVREVLGIGAPGESKPLVDPAVICVCGHRADAHAPFNSPEEPPQECVECKCDQFVGEPLAVGMLRAAVDDRERLHKDAVARWRRERPASADAGESNGYHPQMLQMIPVDQIAPSPTNPRKHFDPVKLRELADSIIEHGLVEPILVRPLSAPHDDDPRYQLVAGERRWRAAKLAGLAHIEVKVRALDDKAVLEIQFIENLQRADLSAIEEAEGYKRLLDEHGYTADSLAGKLGKSKSYVYGRLKLCNLPPAALEALAKGDLPATVGELIGRLPSMELRQELWEQEFGDGLEEAPSFRDIKAAIEREYMRELKGAPFPQNDKKLLPGVPSCKDCPKRTGNNRNDYPDGRADVCTDTDCYDQKVQAFNRRKLDEAAKVNGARVLSPEESQTWFNWGSLANRPETRDYVDLSEDCDEAADHENWDKPTPTYGELLSDENGYYKAKVEVVGLDAGGQVHQLVSRAEAEKILKEKGIKIAKSTEQVVADRKASQQNFKLEKEIRHEAAAEICERVVQSLTDNPFFLGSNYSNRDAGGFLKAVALALFRDFDVAKFIAKRRSLVYGDGPGKFAKKILSDLSEAGTIELIVEYLIAEELDWWIRSGSSKDAPICAYFGHDPRKIEKRIAKERASAKKTKPKAKAVATT